MKANSRRRVLISSIAMLLVALVALSTSTFAWFSTNTKATASTINAKTTQASNLQLSVTGTSGWTDKLQFNDSLANAGTLDPATTANFTTWKTGKADGINTGIASGALTAAAAGENYLTTPIYVKYGNAGGTGTQQVKVVVTMDPVANSDAGDVGTADFFRVALVPKTGNALTTSAIVFGNSNDDYGKDPAQFTTLTPENYDGAYSTVTVEGNSVTLGTLSEGVVYGYDIYVWFEGTDPDCIDDNSVNTIPVSFSFEKV